MRNERPDRLLEMISRGRNPDHMILIVVVLCVLALFGMLAVVHIAIGPAQGPSMYDDAIKIHDGPSRGPSPQDSQD